MVGTSRAVVFDAPGSVRLTEFPLPEIGPDATLLKVEVAGTAIFHDLQPVTRKPVAHDLAESSARCAEPRLQPGEKGVTRTDA